MNNLLIVLSGPSGVGKGTIAKLLIERNKDLLLSVSCTTRAPREGEVHGREYYFITREEFLNRVNNDGFLEFSEHFENCYGTPKDFTMQGLITTNVLLEIDVNGGLNVKKNFPQALLIMITPPSIKELENRLIKRQTETMEKIKKRMERISYELELGKGYDYTVVNDDLMTAVNEIENIISLEKAKRNKGD